MRHYGLERNDKVRFCLLLLICLFTAPLARAQGHGDFRGFVWGVTPSDVQKYETAKFYKNEAGSFYFLERPSKTDYRRLIRYDFKDGRLWRANYEFQEYSEPDSNAVLYRYEDMVRGLKDEYGAPGADDFLWKDKAYFGHPKFWGRALRSGDLRRRTTWRFGETEIVAELYFSKPHYVLRYAAERVGKGGEPATDILGNPLSGTENTPAP